MSDQMRYKPGDKVMIRADLSEEANYADENDGGGMSVAEKMLDYAGKVVTIARCIGTYYEIEEDDGEWCWTIGMFDPAYGEFDTAEVDTSGLSPMFDDLFK